MTDPRNYTTYTVYNDALHESRVYPAWDPVAGKFTGPVQISRQVQSSNYTESLTMSSSGLSLPPNGSESIVLTLSRQYSDNSGRPVVQDRFYNLPGGSLPAADPNAITSPTILTNINGMAYRTLYGYDELGRRSRVADALGDITRTVYDGLGRIQSTWMGTNDTPASGYWSPTNTTGSSNMTKVSENLYDNASSASSLVTGDGNLTQVTQFPDNVAADARMMQMYYDWRNRLVATKSGVGSSETTTDGIHRPIVVYELDNQGRRVVQQVYDGDGATITPGDTSTPGNTSATVSPNNLRKQTLISYDDQDRVYRQVVQGVYQTFGALTTDIFYDHRGNVIATYSPGVVVKKTVYDGAGRVSDTYTTDGATDSGWSSASTVTGNNVLEQTDYTYDLAGNIVLTVSKSRNHDETATGALMTPTASPKARATYATAYYDAANRVVATVQYGTNGGTTVSAPGSSTPPSSSNSVLVTSTSYNASGWAASVTDPKGLVTNTSYDAAGRVAQTIEDYTNGTPTASTNRTTNYSYDGLDHTLTLTAVMPSGTPSQTTHYTYGVTTSSGSGINSNHLLALVQYPDKSTGNASTSSSDQNSFSYDTLGEVVTKTDQNGTVHTYTYDVLGRTTADTITTLASGVDASVRSIRITFDTVGRPYQLTNYADAAGTTVVNQLQRTYNDMDQLIGEYQSHSGAVNTSSTPQVQYAYAAYGNFSRLTNMTYPNGRQVYFNYDDAGDVHGVANIISRVTAIATSTTRGTNDANVIASYDYLGLSTIVRKNYPTPGIRLDRFGGTSGSYVGLDQFNRVINQEWTGYSVSTGTNTTNGDLFKIGHGYDGDSNRLYADNQTQSAAAHAYSYDNLNRLTADKSGVLNSGKTDVPFWNAGNDAWTLDPLGNPTATTQLVGGTQTTLNAQNQIITRKVQGQYPAPIFIDWLYLSSDSVNWQKPGSGDAFDVAGTFSSGLTFTTVAQDTLNGTTEGEARAFVLEPESLGTFEAHSQIDLPSTATTGQFGFVFGYKASSDYWIDVIDIADDHEKVYHVINGAKGSAISSIASGQDVLHTHSASFLTSGQSGQVLYQTLANGFASGQMGLYTTVAGTRFEWVKVFPAHEHSDMAGRWDNYANSNTEDWWFGAIDPSTSRLHTSVYGGAKRPILLKNLNLQNFQATFSFTGESGSPYTEVGFVFNAQGPEDYAYLEVPHVPYSTPVTGSQMAKGQLASSVSATTSNLAATSDADVIWVRVTCNGGTVSVKRLVNPGGTPTDSTWSSTAACFISSSFSGNGGRLGFWPAGPGAIDDLTIKSYNSSTSSFDTTELEEHFTVDSSGYASDTLTYDANGNLTYDGTQSYTYDAWNRLKTTAHAYRDSGGTLHSGQTSGTYSYDAAGRRIVKAVSGTGSMDCTYHDYYAGQSNIEERNGSNQSIKDRVWGLSYVDEAVQTRVNTNPTGAGGAASWTSYWLCQDANYNVLGVVNASGNLAERYEYSAYGQRQVFASSGSNDPGCYTPTSMSGRVVATGSVVEPWGINEVGHQGLVHDEESGLIYNRARMLSPTLGRFMQEDPLKYIPGPDLYLYLRSSPVDLTDASGLDDSISITLLRAIASGDVGEVKFILETAGDLLSTEAKAAAKEFLLKVTKCTATYAAYKALNCRGCGNCPTKADAMANGACLAAEVAGRAAYLQMKCDYVLAGSIARGSAVAEKGHQMELANKTIAAAKCAAKAATLP